MWEQYRKTFLPAQLAIVFICVVLKFYFKVPFAALGVFVIVMELFNLFGAAWAVRLKNKVARQSGMLPTRHD